MAARSVPLIVHSSRKRVDEVAAQEKRKGYGTVIHANSDGTFSLFTEDGISK